MGPDTKALSRKPMPTTAMSAQMIDRCHPCSPPGRLNVGRLGGCGLRSGVRPAPGGRPGGRSLMEHDGTGLWARGIRAGPAAGRYRAAMDRRCARPGCSAIAAATLAYDYKSREVWISDLADATPATHDLCEPHAERLRAPNGWKRHDLRRATDEPRDPGLRLAV